MSMSMPMPMSRMPSTPAGTSWDSGHSLTSFWLETIFQDLNITDKRDLLSVAMRTFLNAIKANSPSAIAAAKEEFPDFSIHYLAFICIERHCPPEILKTLYSSAEDLLEVFPYLLDPSKFSNIQPPRKTAGAGASAGDTESDFASITRSIYIDSFKIAGLITDLMIKLASNNETKVLETLIKKKNSWSIPLIGALQEGDLPTTQALLKVEDDVNQEHFVESEWSTALIVAVQSGHQDIVEALLSVSTIDINKKNKSGMTALCAAASRNQLSIIPMLLRKGADPVNTIITAKTSGWKSQILEALKAPAYREDLLRAIVRSLYHQYPSETQEPLLYSEISATDIAIQAIKEKAPAALISKLISAGANLTETLKTIIESLPHTEPATTRIELGELGELGASAGAGAGPASSTTSLSELPDYLSELLSQALITPVIKKIAETRNIALLLKRLEAEKTKTPLLIEYVKTGNLPWIQALLAAGDPVNQADTDETTALMWAAFCSRKITEELLKHPKIDVNLQNKFGHSALTVAAKSRDTDVLSCLLAHPSININARNKFHATALTLAAEKQILANTRLLLEHGADAVEEILSLKKPDSKNPHALTFLTSPVLHEDLLSAIVRSLGSRESYLSGTEDLSLLWKSVSIQDIATTAIALKAPFNLIIKLIQDSKEPAELFRALIQRNQFFENLEALIPVIAQTMLTPVTDKKDLFSKIERRHKILEVIRPVLIQAFRIDALTETRKRQSMKLLITLSNQAILNYELKKVVFEKRTVFKLNDWMYSSKTLSEHLLRQIETIPLKILLGSHTDNLHYHLRSSVVSVRESESKFKFINPIKLIFDELMSLRHHTEDRASTHRNLGLEFYEALCTPPAHKKGLARVFSKGEPLSEHEIDVLKRYQPSLIGLSTLRQKQDLLKLCLAWINAKSKMPKTTKTPPLTHSIETLIDVTFSRWNAPRFDDREFLEQVKETITSTLHNPKTSAEEREAFHHIFLFMLEVINALLDQLDAPSTSLPTRSTGASTAIAGAGLAGPAMPETTSSEVSWLPEAPFSVQMTTPPTASSLEADAADTPSTPGLLLTPTAPPASPRHLDGAHVFMGVRVADASVGPIVSPDDAARLFNALESLMTQEYPTGLIPTHRQALIGMFLPHCSSGGAAGDREETSVQTADELKICRVTQKFLSILDKYSSLSDEVKQNAFCILLGATAGREEESAPA